MINPGEIPQITGDVEVVATQGAILRTQGRAFAATGTDVDSTWQGLAAVYVAPEAAQLFAATGPVKERTETVGSQVSAVGDALVAYADEVRPIKAELASLRVQAEAFVRVATANPDWRADPALVAENNRLVTAVDAQVAAWMAAQRECANAIDRLDGGIQYVQDNGDENQAANEYGYSAAALDQAAAGGALPWGSPEELDKPWWEDGLDLAGSFVEGFFVDGLAGAVQGLGQLVGFGGSEGLEQSWGGLARLGLALTPLRLVNDYTDLPGLPKGALSGQLDQTARALLAADEWGKDPARAAGAVVFNIVSVILGTKGVGAGVRGGAAAAEGTGAVAESAGLLARLTMKVSDLVAATKARIPTIHIPDVFKSKIVADALDDTPRPLNGDGSPSTRVPRPADYDRHGNYTDGTYRVSEKANLRHTDGHAPPGRSTFYPGTDLDRLAIEAAQQADHDDLWRASNPADKSGDNPAKAKVTFDRDVGVIGSTGQSTRIVNVYKKRNGTIHISPGS